MGRPTTKVDLMVAANDQYTKLWKLIDTMPEAAQAAAFLFEDRDRNLRDILIHLYEWHQLLLRWINANQNGKAQAFLPAPYNWKTYPQMNVGFWERHQATPYDEAKQLLVQSHMDVMALIEPFSNEALFSKQYFTWTGTTTLGSYCVSATASHYDWAMKKIKKHIKTYQELHKA